MRTRIAAAAAAIATGATIFAAPTALAQPQQNGLVNVAIGDITIQDIAVGVAANILANVCGVQVPVAVLARQVIANDDSFTGTCTNQNNAPFEVTA